MYHPYNIPERLEDWTHEKIKELVDNNVNESEILDYKEEENPERCK